MPALCDGSATQFHQSSYRDIQPPETRMKQADPESDSAQETVRAEREVLTQTLPGTKSAKFYYSQNAGSIEAEHDNI